MACESDGGIGECRLMNDVNGSLQERNKVLVKKCTNLKSVNNHTIVC